MNMRIENGHDDFEEKLNAMSIVEPGEEYSRIPSQLNPSKPIFWLGAWPWVTASLLVIMGAFYLMPDNSVIECNSGVASNLDSTGVETIAGINPASSAVLEAIPSRESSYELGTHYNLLPTLVPPVDQKINEVVAFFWYPCRPCYGFEQSLQEWEKSLATDTRVTRIPAIWSEQMRFHARAFYTAEALGVLDRAHPLLFREFEKEPTPDENERQLMQFFAGLGISANDFLEAFNSELTLERLTLAEIANRDYFVQSTPALYIQGRYYISPAIGGIPNMFVIADYLLKQVDSND